MKKITALLLLVAMFATLVACSGDSDNSSVAESSVVESSKVPTDDQPADNTSEPATESSEPETDSSVMSYEEYAAAELNSEVVVETYVQATQSWWDNKITAYCQSPDGAYFAYEMACSEEDAAKLLPGTLIRITGFKGEWEGEVEIMDATFEFVQNGDAFIAEAFDATALLGTEDLIKHQNEFVSFKGLTIEKVEYKNGEPGDDIYVTLGKDGASYDFCVERYLTAPDSDVYKAVGELKVGDIVNVEGFLYWYQNANPHITSIKLASDSDVMSYEDYAAAELNSEVVVETYVQATQSWWDNKITVYCQSPDGAYFLYELACSEEDAAKLVPGTKIRVTGYKGEWEGEVEIMDGKFEFVEGDSFIAEAFDATALLGTEDLIKHQNEFVSFKGLTVEKIEYKNGEPGDDIYVTLGKDGKSYDFCVERYLTAPDTDVYKAVGELKTGDVVNVEGFLYWYQNANPHITAIALA